MKKKLLALSVAASISATQMTCFGTALYAIPSNQTRMPHRFEPRKKKSKKARRWA